ncbi:hypothetical protein AB0M46_43890 [Dactylosporangium sp. NPDC051485]|uniref:hypothetical protein n=1 Tax=Dactylosporangium sp. NPDC051485 TaxID=3154846 RepID=UPI00341CA087
MANLTQVYRGPAETVTIMAYLGADAGDLDEIRRIVERHGSVVEDGIAYVGPDGRRWLDEQHEAYVTRGLIPSCAA